MRALDDLAAGLDGFDWDEGKSAKNWLRDEVQQAEAEQALLNTPLVVNASHKHEAAEPRHVALGQTDAGRLLTVVFTIRGTKIRVISARAMSRPERLWPNPSGLQDPCRRSRVRRKNGDSGKHTTRPSTSIGRRPGLRAFPT